MSETDLIYQKSEWGDGPWQFEPDRLEFVHAGLPCMLIRNRLGNWCGYVAVCEGHPAFKQDYNNVPVDVHGGLTYSAPCQGHICHVPKPGEPDDVWWLGFDCGHAWDYIPAFAAMRKFGGPWEVEPAYDHAEALRKAARRPGDWVEVYRDLGYVRKVTEDLAEQLARMKEDA